MGHKHDYWEDLRRFIIPPFGKIVQAINEAIGTELYVHSHSRNHEFVGRVPMSEEDFEEYLHEWGFERNPLAALKYRLQHSDVEEGSWRKIGFEDDPEYQIHVILYDGSQINNANDGETFVYAHWEYRWDVHPIKHYRGINIDENKGVKMVRDLLDEADIDYEYVQP